MKGEAYEREASRVPLRCWGQRLVLLGVLGRSGRGMEFGLVNVQFETPVPHAKGGTENTCWTLQSPSLVSPVTTRALQGHSEVFAHCPVLDAK